MNMQEVLTTLVKHDAEIHVEYQPRGKAARAARRTCIIVGKNGYVSGKITPRTIVSMVQAKYIKISFHFGTVLFVYQLTDDGRGAALQ